MDIEANHDGNYCGYDDNDDNHCDDDDDDDDDTCRSFLELRAEEGRYDTVISSPAFTFSDHHLMILMILIIT